MGGRWGQVLDGGRRARALDGGPLGPSRRLMGSYWVQALDWRAARRNIAPAAASRATRALGQARTACGTLWANARAVLAQDGARGAGAPARRRNKHAPEKPGLVASAATCRLSPQSSSRWLTGCAASA